MAPENQPDLAEMSDEDFLDIPESDYQADVPPPTDEDAPPEDDQDDDQDQDDNDDNEDSLPPGSDEDDEESDDEGQDDDAADPDDEGAEGSDSESSETDTDSDDTDEDVEEKKSTQKTSDNRSDEEYAKIGRMIMGDFKANGQTMRMKSPEDAIQLMQMGANYHKKMTGLKPSLKTLKLLENNGLLDDEKINYLIDLSQNKPEAITKLLRDSKIDPMDLDLEKDGNYKPSQRTVSETDDQLDDVLESISGTKSYERTVTLVANQWDESSRAAISKEPRFLAILNAQMESGIYDQVADAVAYERSLGRLAGISDFDAYQMVGQQMHESGAFTNANGGSNTESSNRQGSSKAHQDSDENSGQRQDRKDRKKAVSSSRGKKAPSSKKKDNYNPLEMSDEDFLKMNNISI